MRVGPSQVGVYSSSTVLLWEVYSELEIKEFKRTNPEISTGFSRSVLIIIKSGLQYLINEGESGAEGFILRVCFFVRILELR